MCRGNWELAALARHRIADLAHEWRSCSSLGRGPRGPRQPVARLRHGLGLRLIWAGQALAGADVAGRHLERFVRPPAW